MLLRRRDFLKGTIGAATTLALGGGALGCRRNDDVVLDTTGWRPGAVKHLLPTADDRRIRLKASFREPLADAPQLYIGDRSLPGRGTDSAGLFWVFDAAGLEPARAYTLELRSGAGDRLCDPWSLSTLPGRDDTPERFRLLSYTCAGGPEIIVDTRLRPAFRSIRVRRRLLARALATRPDAVIANGDHVYWDLRSRAGWAMGRSPQAWWTAGYFDREQPMLGTENEEVLKKAFGPQIADLYGTLFRSVPVFFLQDDHDYGENDEASDALRTFPPDPFMLDLARTTQRLYYPELLGDPTLPPVYLSADGVCESFGRLRYGRLFEGLFYDCRRYMTNDADPRTGHRDARLVPEAAERWLLERTAASQAHHLAHLPSTPVLWTAGKWGEWYPDVQDEQGRLSIEIPKPYWPRGWFEQHNRLLQAAAARGDSVPLFLSGDLHATGVGRILHSGDLSLEHNPVVSVLSGTIGTGHAGWPSNFRGQPARPSRTLKAEEWIAPIEENGFTVLDFEPDRVELSFFRWKPEQGEEAIATLEPFRVIELPR
jgi:hypothetical protein